ncbi:unnamed protein product [Rotaria sp. Silwood2]|nr:unnamed protein product [Rotaria sp. Silwood2]CAF2863671.1 unnamed protein product [Rotaria sp. Silwood2]CAF3261978.1 unnamed protein product [Rotaria sp. Silwood2]CAF3958087.1 unnamed protein product [Rotaria sp. Silwood2]CAF4075848.1 unnamed protein product [Rotaria sp. Silwood2]
MCSSRSINIHKGDLTKQQADVIVVCLSSIALLETVLKAGGDAVLASYNSELRKNSTNITAVAASGQLLAKEIYFLPWEPNSDEALLCESLKTFVSNAIKKAANDNYTSIAFPAIGCGQYGCSINLVAKTLIGEAFRLQTVHPIAIFFIIQPHRTDIYDEFQKQINLLEPLEPTPEIPSVSVSIGNGMIVVENGNITTQKVHGVDAIIGSSSSIALQQTIIEAAGNEVKTAYETEYRRNPNSILISTPPGQLSCQRIFFLKWKPNVDDSILRQSIVDFIWTVIQNVISYNYTSVAFPAIGCGGYGCSVDIVVKTMVREIKNQLKTRNLSLTVKFVIQPEQKNIYDEFCKQVLASEEVAFGTAVEDQLPATWEKSTRNQLRFMVPTNTNEYKFILTDFDKTMKGKYTQIIKIERIQNERWLLQYLAHSRDFKKRLSIDTEKHLYHGCPDKAANSIIEDCFNRSFAGVNGTAYGVGVYFSLNAAYSHDYTQPNVNEERCMFVSRVLIGKTTKGNSSMKTRPLGFDSTTDGNHIFVTYHDAQALAEYLITYK